MFYLFSASAGIISKTSVYMFLKKTVSWFFIEIWVVLLFSWNLFKVLCSSLLGDFTNKKWFFFNLLNDFSYYLRLLVFVTLFNSNIVSLWNLPNREVADGSLLSLQSFLRSDLNKSSVCVFLSTLPQKNSIFIFDLKATKTVSDFHG